jgi:hypothetical protein
MAKNSYTHRVIVRNIKGHDFPIDMLRYDGLIPANESDSVTISI